MFVTVVEAGSFSGAAARMEVSRAAVSKAVSRLEERLGARLLQRTTRRLSLTEAGRTLFERSHRALDELEEAGRQVARLHDAPRGRLRISAPVYFGVRHFAPVLTEYLQRYPEVDADVQLDDRLVNVVAEGFDLALRVSRLKDSSLVGRRLAPCRQVVCAAPEYWRRRGIPATPGALADHDCFVYSNLPRPGTWRFADANGREIGVEVRGRLRFNNTEMARGAALAGLGVVMLPTFYVGDELWDGRLVAVLGEFRAGGDASVYAVYPARDHLPLKVRLLLELLAERFGPEPYWDRP